MDLNGKVALVTGAASGIGLTYVKELLKNNVKGVLMVDINLAAAEKELQQLHKEFGNLKVFFQEADISHEKQLEEAFQTAIKIFNQLDIVINNAGIVDEIQWEKSCFVNLHGTIAGTKLAVEKYLPEYKSTDDAIVINTSSIFGYEPSDDVPVYTATKFGVLGYVRAMGSKFRYEDNKIRVIGICPGKTATPMGTPLEQKILEPFLTKILDFFSPVPDQPPESVAKHVMDLIRSAPSGSIWKIINEKCGQLEFPKYEIAY